MAKKILSCPKCGTYTLHEECATCGGKTQESKPPKYSPEDKYGGYRRTAKRETLEQEGLL
ncbi:MAG: RNA-protein complex protein Nop10 [archaeon]